MRNRTIVAIVGAIVAVLVIIGITTMGRQNQTTQQELLPGTTQPAPTSDQIIDGEAPAPVPVPSP